MSPLFKVWAVLVGALAVGAAISLLKVSAATRTICVDVLPTASVAVMRMAMSPSVKAVAVVTLIPVVSL